MTYKEEALEIIMNKIQSISVQQRDLVDIYKKFSLDHTTGLDYIAVEAYKSALVDILQELRSIDAKPKNSSNIRPKKGGKLI